MEVTTRSLEEFKQQARREAAGLVARKDSATIVALSGDLGAGKTVFVQAVAAHFGIPEPVTSPTFVIQKIYNFPNVGHPVSYMGFKRLVHIDAYRLKGARDLEILGWKEIVADPENLILIEWPERIADAIPKYAIQISLSGSEQSRFITIAEG